VKHFVFPATLFLSLFGSAICANAQDQLAERQYLSEVLALTTKKNAAYYRTATGKEGELYVARTFTMDGRVKAEGTYADVALTVEHGQFTFYHPNGKVESQGQFVMGLKAGVWQRFDQWGRPLAEKVYDPEALANIVYTRAQTMPEFPGGEKALVRVIQDKVKAPEGRPFKGQVMASFIVEKSGELTEVKVVDGADEQLGREVVQAIKATSPWTPGEERGVPVRVQVRLPVQF
jgi:TonB family protein